MSCAALEELSLSEQIAVQQSWDATVVERVRALLNAFEPPVAPGNPLCQAPPCPAGGSNPLLTAEQTAMMQHQCMDHPPLQVCHPGHLPKMFEVTGDLRTVYHVECGTCAVRTPRFQSQDAAAAAWARRDVMPIRAVA